MGRERIFPVVEEGGLRVSGKKFYALGRLKTGEMNKTESAYSAHLEMLRIAGELLWHKFEGLKLRLADNTFLTVEVLEFAGPMHGCIDCWYISHHGQERDPGSGFRWFVPDAEMLPIRPGDLKEVDETEKEVESV